MRSRRLYRGVTLVEVLIVVSIMAVISGAAALFAVPMFKEAKIKTADKLVINQVWDGILADDPPALNLTGTSGQNIRLTDVKIHQTDLSGKETVASSLKVNFASVPEIDARFGLLFTTIELAAVIAFGLEYLARLFSASGRDPDAAAHPGPVTWGCARPPERQSHFPPCNNCLPRRSCPDSSRRAWCVDRWGCRAR